MASRASEISAAFGADGPVLEVAAVLHDIGYSPTLAMIGFHQVHGARYLRQIGVDERIVGLVAFHSFAHLELCGIAPVLMSEFDRQQSVISDALCYCDMTTSPRGERVDVWCHSFPRTAMLCPRDRRRGERMLSWLRKLTGRRPDAGSGLKVGMSRSEVLHCLGEPDTKSDTNQMRAAYSGAVISLGRRPPEAELWLYNDVPEPGKSSMVRFVKGRVQLVHVDLKR